jgi:pimeloyl-ACP methyl ester carboxylesterase
MKRVFFTGTLALVVLMGKAQTTLLDPQDSIVVYDSLNAPRKPELNVGTKWVVTPTIRSFNTASYKSYYYNGMPFRLQFPKSYVPNTGDGKKYPVVVVLSGKEGMAKIYDNELQLKQGGIYFKNLADSGLYDGYVLYPQAQKDSGWGKKQAELLIDIFRYMANFAKLDINRIVLVGIGNGSLQGWQFVAHYPVVYAGVIGISGAPNLSAKKLEQVKEMSAWVVKGPLSEDAYPELTDSLVQRLNSLGMKVSYSLLEKEKNGWASIFSSPDFLKFILTANKSNPVVLKNRLAFQSGEQVNTRLYLPEGMDNYQWRKDGQIIAGKNTYDLGITEAGKYEARVKRGTDWSQWSTVPLTVTDK